MIVVWIFQVCNRIQYENYSIDYQAELNDSEGN